jgi:carboxypeptidase Q
MMHMRQMFLGILLATAGTTQVAPAQDAVAEQVLQQAAKENRSYEYLDRLVNGFGARLTASSADHEACNWAVEEFKAMGLENVHLQVAGEFPAMFNRGPWTGEMVSPERVSLEFSTPAWTAGTKGAVTADAVMQPTSVEGLDAADFAGKWILTQGQQRGRGAQSDMTPEERREADERRRAIRNFLDEAGVAGYIRSSGSEYIRSGGNYRISWDDLPTIPQIIMVDDHWKMLQGRIEAGEQVVLEFDIRNHFIKGPSPFYNVVADIPGTDKADELIIVGGHIDSWDSATGTVDDGIGTAIAMGAAQMLAASGVQPRRTIRFMLWSGEEQGLLGSRAYVDQNPELMEKISAVFNYDGGPNPIAAVDCTPAFQAEFERIFAPVMELDPELPFTINVREDGMTAGGSDHVSFFRKGVPAFMWSQRGPLNFRHALHTQFDTFDQADPRYTAHSTVVVALAAIGTANLDEMLSREGLTAQRGGGQAAGRTMGVYLEGVAVTSVIPDGVAAKAGLKAGDTFVKVDGNAVGTRAELVRAIQAGGPKKAAVVKRDGKEVELTFSWEAGS